MKARYGGRRSSLARPRRARGLRGLTALTLSLTVASTGLVALAAPARADVPAPTVTGPATNPGNSTTPTWTWTSNATPAGTDFECSLDATGQTPAGWAPCGPAAYTAPALASPGSWTLSVREVVPGDTGLVATSDYVLDTVATGSVAPARAVTNALRPDWIVSSEKTAACELDGVSYPGDCTGTWTSPVDLTPGQHTLRATFTDALLNTGSASATVLVDRTNPGQPVPARTGSNPTNANALTWSWNADDAVSASCVLLQDGVGGTPFTCGSINSHTAVVSADGDYQLAVTLTDAAGNTSTEGTSAVTTYDGTPPAAPVISGVTPALSPSNNRRPTWTFTTPGAGPGVTTTCVLTSAAGTLDLGTCAGSVTPPSPLAESSWVLTVTSKDAAGNTASTPSDPYEVDLTPPNAPTVSRPAALGNNPLPRFTFLGDVPTTGECRLAGTTTWDACNTARYYDLDLRSAPDGVYAVEVRLTDVAGNTGAVGTSAGYTLDRTPPAAADLTGVPLVGNDTTPTYDFAVETRGSATCTTTQGATVVDTQVCTNGSYTPAPLAAGTYTVTVVTRDEATNSTTATRSYTLDTTAPGAPTVVSPSSPGRGTSPSWGITGDGDSTLSCTLNTVPPAGPTTCTNGYLGNLAGQADGSYTLTVTATDPAGNTTTATSTYVLDRTPPSAPTVTGPTSPGNAFAPQWTFVVPAQTTAQCRLVQGMTTGTWAPCNGGSFVATNLADGTYTVDVLVTDTAGNDAPLASSSAYRSDRTAPAAPTVTGPSGYGRVTNPVWTWTGESGASATCRLDRAGVIGTAVDCSSGSFAPGTTGDSSYVVVVQLTDAAGNPSNATTTPVYVLDTGVPLAPAVSGPTGTSRVATVTWTFTSEAGALTECSLVRGGVAGAWTTCASGASRTLPGDGSYVLQVRQTDAAGNQSPLGSSGTYSYDGTPPSTPVVTTPSGPSSSLAPALSFSVEAGSTPECRLLRAGALVRDWAACTSPTTADLTGQPDGTYVVEVRSTDTAGNVSASGAGQGYVLDTTPPDAPTVTGPAGPSTQTTPTFTWTGEAGTTSRCRLVLGGVAQGTGAVGCSSPYSPTLAGDGQWALRVALVDAAGNRSAISTSGLYVLDTTPPVAPVVTAPTSPGRGTAPSWSAVVETGATTECRLTSGTTVVSDWTTCRLPLVTDLSTTGDGTYTLSVRATDAAGLTGPAGSASYVLDTTAPAAPVFTSVPASPSRSRALSFAFTGEPGATFTCRLTSGPTVLDPDTTCTSPLPVSLTGLPDGTYTVSVKATDAAGNVGAAQTATQVLDTIAPLAPVLVTGPAATAPDPRPTWVFTSETGSTLTCRVVGATTGTVVPDSSCTSPYQPTLPADDTYAFSVRAADAAGNQGPALTGTYVLDSSAPATAVVVGPASPGRSTTPTWQVSASEGTVQCKLVRGSVLVRDWATCGPTFSVPLGTDGLYVLSARVVDSAGNLSAEVQSRYALDTTPPAPAVVVSPQTSTDRNPGWSVSSPELGVTAQCQVLGPSGAVVKPLAACAVSTAGSPYGLDLTGAADGGYTLVVRLTDLAGNTGADARGTYVLDTLPPSSVLVVPPPSPSAAVTPTWTLTGDSDAVLECRLTGPGITAPVFAPCTSTVPGAGTFTAALGALADGTYTLTTRSRDAAGNLGPETTSSYELDRVPPAAPSVPVAPASPSKVAGITWTFTLEPGSSALCTLSSATAVVAAEQSCASPVPTDLTAYGDGTYTLSVRAVDPAGNPSAPVTATYTYDTTPPPAPTITSEPASPSKDTRPQWSVVASEDGGTLECQLLGLPSPQWAACAQPVVFDLAPAVTGSFQLQVRQVDAAGNVSDVDTSTTPYVLDLTKPSGPIVTPVTASPDHVLQPVFAIDRKDTEPVTLRCAVDRPDGAGSSVNPCAFTKQAVVDLSSPTPLVQPGQVLLRARTVDALGNESGDASATYLFDDVPPVAPVLRAQPEDHGYTSPVTWSFGGGDSEIVTFLCQLVKKGVTGPSALSVCTSGEALPFPSGYGDYVFSVYAVDRAGNVSKTPASATYTYAAPVPTVAGLRGPTVGTSASPTWTFTVPRGFTAACTLSGAGASIEADVPCTSGTYTAPLDGQAAGTYTLVVTLTDAFGTSGRSTRSAYRYTPLVVDPGHLGQPGTGTPGTRPPTVPPVRTPTGPTVTPTGPTTPTTDGRDPEVPRPSATVPPKVKGPRALVPLAPLPAIEDIPKLVPNAIRELGKKPTIPLLLLFIVVGFLLLQNQIDRRDPKLASAPSGAEPELDFGPVLGPRPARGGALA